MPERSLFIDTGNMTSIHRVNQHQEPSIDVARLLWRTGMVILIVASIAGLAFSLKLIADDLATSGEKFDGLGTFIGAIMAAFCAVVGLLHVAMFTTERRSPRLPVLFSALVPALYLLFRLESLPTLLTGDPIQWLSPLLALGWTFLCGFLVISRSPKAFART